MYIAVEGVDGSGKDTQAYLLAEVLRSKGLSVETVAEPSTLPTGKLLRELLLSGQHQESHPALFLADRLALQTEKLAPDLRAGKTVISVRSFISTLAYQQENWSLDWLLTLHSRMLVYPSIVILLDVDPTTGLSRVSKRGTYKEVYEKLDVQKRVRQRYLDLLLPDGKNRKKLKKVFPHPSVFAVLDSSLPSEQTHSKILELINSQL